MELDFGKTMIFYRLQLKIETRSSTLIPVPDIRKHRICTKFCPQLVDGKIFFLSCSTNREPNDPVKLQLWACDLSIFIDPIIIVDDKIVLKDWIEIKSSESVPHLYGHLLPCNNHLVYYGTCEEDSNPFFCEVWSLPFSISSFKLYNANRRLDTPRAISTLLNKTQQTLKDFFFEAPYSDISFEVESESIKAHKWWLIQRNKFFANMFASNIDY